MRIEKELRILAFRGLALVLFGCAFPVALSAAAPIVLEAGRHQIAFDPANGSIVRVSESGATGALLRNDERGLWELKFRDGSRLSATDFQAGATVRRFEWQRDSGGKILRLSFRGPEAAVVVTVTADESGFDLIGQVTPTTNTLTEFVLPGRLRFAPEEVERFVSPLHPHLGVGAAFNSAFFKPQPADKAVSWKPQFLKYESPYPPVFADFMHLDSRAGRASLYRIQPRNWKPWAGEHNPEAIFIPGRLGLGGDEQGGWCERAFGAFVPDGQAWTAPVVRLALGTGAEQDLRAYAQANGITRTLRAKLAPELFEKFRRAVLVKLDGNARDMITALDKLPTPALIHYSDYLKGGFDKEYPDHLPPNLRFGTPAELRELHDHAHALGHLLMPYTNPTWWCDHPRGPSFERAGEAPLLVRLDGKPAYERYGKNDGWTITLWHPAVRAANLETLRQFTSDYPADILLQDQCGARGWSYDLNPASPSPLAYTEGMLSLVDEQSAMKPLSTEDGWDRVVNAEVQLCGFTFALGPGRRVAWAQEMKSVYHPSTWELYPFAQGIAHDKTALLHHDLGKFVADRPTLAWTLGLGFAMSYRISAKALNEPAPREWLRWVDRLQKSIAARYVGEPVTVFSHQQGSTASGDDGVIRATYGPVRLIANLSATPRQEDGYELPGYGFHATGPGLIAGNVRSLAGAVFGEEGVCFVAEGDAQRAEVWLYAAAGSEVAAELPAGMGGELSGALDNQPARSMTADNAILRLRLPDADKLSAKPFKQLWHAEVKPR